MKNAFNFFVILLLYLATVPTNVIALGAFTEVWMKDFQISRQNLTLLYLLSTYFVFVLLIMIKVRYSLKITLLSLGFCCLLPVVFTTTITLFFTFVILQWLGQGWLVEACRTLLLQTSSRTSYGISVGFMEAAGTIAVFLCPFFFLFLIQNFNWRIIFICLGMFYIVMGIIIAPYSYSIKSLCFNNFQDRKFLLSNILIYLPVVLASGFFFHLEACGKIFNLPLNLLETCSLKQGIGIVILQIILGYFWKNNRRTACIYLCVLIISQMIWLFNLFAFNTTVYLISTILGWSLFGVLINTFWQYLYPNNLVLNEQKLKASVAFGFLANAIGPIVFYGLISVVSPSLCR